jgi:uncharacterized protein (TIGR01777 family)
MQIVITGATGFVGKPLTAQFLQAGHHVTALSRDAARARSALGNAVHSVVWGSRSADEWKEAVTGADVVVHLAGESVAGQRWTPEFKERIRSSRVDTTRALVDAIAASDRRPDVFICASAVGYYGDRGNETITEASAPGKGFLPEVCCQWEAEAQRAAELGLREARMRIGLVLGEGGALEKMLYPLPLPISPWKVGMGGPMGNGQQWMPWIHLDDVVGLFFWAATNPAVQGAVNVTAPNPVTNVEFARALGRVLGRPAFVPVPGLALRMMLGEFADAILGGQKALPAVAQRLGYVFRYPDLEATLRALLKKG